MSAALPFGVVLLALAFGFAGVAGTLAGYAWILGAPSAMDSMHASMGNASMPMEPATAAGDPVRGAALAAAGAVLVVVGSGAWRGRAWA